jgi:hypothetical protein
MAAAASGMSVNAGIGTVALPAWMLGINPKEATDLVWKFIQYYDDGTKEEFTGPVGSRLPSPVVALKAPAGK